MAVTVAHLGRHSWSGVSKKGNWRTYGQKTRNEFHPRSSFAHSTGTTISFARTMFKRVRAASSIVRGSERSCSISTRKDWLELRKPSTSVCMRAYCCDAVDIRLCVRIVTVAQIAAVATMIIPKITQAGTTPPRRLTSTDVPIYSCEISRTDEKGEAARGATLCARIRSSTQ